jgi:AcrR family transcriptional regulator
MSGVARELGTSVSGLYRYVEGLEQLIVALQRRAIEGYRKGLLHAIDTAACDSLAPEDPKRAALRHVVTSFGYYAKHAERHPTRHRLLGAFLSEPSTVLSDDAARSVDTTLGQVIAISAASLTAARETGALAEGDDEQRTYVLWAGLHGLDQFRKRDRIQPPRLQTATLHTCLLRDMLVGFGADPCLLATILDAASQQ